MLAKWLKNVDHPSLKCFGYTYSNYITATYVASQIQFYVIFHVPNGLVSTSRVQNNPGLPFATLPIHQSLYGLLTTVMKSP